MFESGTSISVVRVWISISVKARKNPGSKSSSRPGRFHIAEGPVVPVLLFESGISISVVRVLDTSISVVRVLENSISVVQDQEIVHIAERYWV